MKLTTLAVAALLLVPAATVTLAQDKPAPAGVAAKHKLAIQVSENNPAVMTVALNNAQNVINYFKKKGEAVDVQIVAYNQGLHMYREDTSPVKVRIAEMSLANPNLTFAACSITHANHTKAENKEIKLLSEAKMVPSGVITLMDLQRQGYAYIRP